VRSGILERKSSRWKVKEPGNESDRARPCGLVPAVVTVRVARSSTRALSVEAAVSWTSSAVRPECSPQVGMIAIVLNLLVRDRQSTSSFTPRKSIGQIALLLRIPWLESPSDEPLPLGLAQSLTAHDGDGEKEVYRQWTHRRINTRESKDPKVAWNAGLRIAWQYCILR
jgi:hypothetical protein